MTFLVSCDNEALDSALLNNASPSNNTTTVDYWPSSLNNTWNYESYNISDPFKIVSTSNISGNTYYNFTNFFGQFDLLDNTILMQMRKDNGNYFIRYPNSFYTFSNIYTSQVDAREFLFFNHNKNVGETWSSTYTLNETYTLLNPPYTSSVVTTNKNVLGTMLGRDMSITINGVTYSDVLYFKIYITSATSNQNETEYYWFSKDIGCIKGSFSDSMVSLTSYTLN